MGNEFSDKHKEKIRKAWKVRYDAVEKYWKGRHLQIRIFPDDSAFITDEKGNVLAPQGPASIEGPQNTYQQAVWHNKNPETCVWHNGNRV